MAVMSGHAPAPHISLYLSSLNGIDTALHYAAEFRRIGVEISLCVEGRIAHAVREAVSDVRVFEVPPFTRRLRWLDRIYQLVRANGSRLVMGDNSGNIDLILPRRAWKRSAALIVHRLPGKPSSKSLNNSLARVFGWLVPLRFPAKHVLVISTAQTPLLLCRPDLRVDTVVDSWDHPVRRVAGYRTHTAIAWNTDLAEDWGRHQGARQLAIGPAVKLQYAINSPVAKAVAARVALYPMATTRYAGPWFADEMRLLESICRGTAETGWQLVVKPKPMTEPDELAGLSQRWEHVQVGAYHTSSGALDYRLDDDYNAQRLKELRAVGVVINSVTTFGLDAACAGVPLLQINVTGVAELGSFSVAASNAHLHRHLYRLTQSSLITPTDLRSLEGQLQDFLCTADLSSARIASDRLREWVSQGTVSPTDSSEALLGSAYAAR
jgi:hypothetical protein